MLSSAQGHRMTGNISVLALFQGGYVCYGETKQDIDHGLVRTVPGAVLSLGKDFSGYGES